MVEPLLYAALGFLTASLVALFMGRALWHRAVRLTTHRIMRRLPLSRDEIVASRDLLRAEQAIEHRRLERLANVMRQRMTQSMADVGRRDSANFALRTGIGEANAKTAAAEAREADARKTIDELKAQSSNLRKQLAQTEGSLNETQRLQKELSRERTELIQLADKRRLDVAAAQNEIAQLKMTLAALEKQLDATTRELAETQNRLGRSVEAGSGETQRVVGMQGKLNAVEASLAQALGRADAEARAAEALRAEKIELEKDLALARIENQSARRDASGASAEEITVLRQQIERLASDISRVAGNGAGKGGSGSAGPLQAAVRATRETDQLSAAPVTFPPVR